MKSHSGSQESIDKGNSNFCRMLLSPAVVHFRHCITMVLKLAGFKTCFHIIELPPVVKSQEEVQVHQRRDSICLYDQTSLSSY